MRERSDFADPPNDSAQLRCKVHRGWSWFCGCAAFVREGSDVYLLVPCVRHTAETQM